MQSNMLYVSAISHEANRGSFSLAATIRVDVDKDGQLWVEDTLLPVKASKTNLNQL